MKKIKCQVCYTLLKIPPFLPEKWAQEKYLEYDVNYALFADESTFHKKGFVNRYNFHYYPSENPKFIKTTFQTIWKLNVWGGIIGR